MHKEHSFSSCQYPPQSKIISSLLDCSDTLKIKNRQRRVLNQQESICPWVYPNPKPLEQKKANNILTKSTRVVFNRTFTKYKSKPNRQLFSKTILSNKKTKGIQGQIQNYQYMSSNVINLTKELQLIHHKKKNTYVNNYIRQQLYLRLKTN